MGNSPRCAHWVAKLQDLFPQTESPLTPGMVLAMSEIMESYSEKVLAKVCGSFGICADPEHKYFPSISELKSALDAEATKQAGAAQYSERVKAQLEERERIQSKNKPKPDYTGPIEDVKPGDILTVERQQEYREFMAKKHNMKDVKLWGQNEVWTDSGARPFGRQEETKGKYQTLASIRETYPEFMQKVLRGQDPDKPKFDPVKAKEELLAKYGVSQEAFDAIPDQKDYNWQTMHSNKPTAKPLTEKPEEPNPFE